MMARPKWPSPLALLSPINFLFQLGSLAQGRPLVGGQAVIEGVMMRCGERVSVAVRRPGSGEIVTCELRPFRRGRRLSKIPFIRGVYNLFDVLVLGVKALNLSANLALEEEEGSFGPLELALTLTLAMGIAIGGFFILPLWLVNLFASETGAVLFNLMEGAIRTGIFLLYLWGISLLREIRRVFEYHGAEHKSIHTFEHGEELTPQNARKYTTLHPRCGTSFLLLVVVISILVFSLVGNPPLPWKILSRVLLLPVVAGLSYELLMLSGRHTSSRWVRALSAPGLWLQRLTTREPDDRQLEVALTALRAVL